ncbi:MAG: HEAT repeat domain-containing protein [Terriglobia bacterium]
MNHSPGFSKSTPEKAAERRLHLIIYGVAFLMVLVPFLFWQGTWFGRKLSEQEMAKYLSPNAKPRNIQHALLQISEQIAGGKKEEVKKWYPNLLALSNHPVSEVRVTVAWSLGQDSQEPAFRSALQNLLKDPNLLVRRNSALALVRFGDGSGREELMNILKPVPVLSPRDGKIQFRLKEDDSLSPGTLVARIQTGESEPFEFRSPLPGYLEEKLVADGKTVSLGEPVFRLSPSEEEVWEALRGLYFVGQIEDISGIEVFTGRSPHMTGRIQQQARLTIDEIKKRNSN